MNEQRSTIWIDTIEWLKWLLPIFIGLMIVGLILVFFSVLSNYISNPPTTSVSGKVVRTYATLFSGTSTTYVVLDSNGKPAVVGLYAEQIGLVNVGDTCIFAVKDNQMAHSVDCRGNNDNK